MLDVPLSMLGNPGRTPPGLLSINKGVHDTKSSAEYSSQ